ncbi:hypothetical protein KGF57_004845 [Candida theae]|uniref:Uncharacterized protein n=1 Tax=Candida theae TaxID=1198502 RepID=A0AAD5BB33_9ASCO|nr:uncharacterized protein KGF57_004845 [Candida theae]KAI5949246.1 hypothetical protein KGF57_004845 [Candida theae]
MLKNSTESYIDGYMRLAWIILSTSPQLNPPPRYTHLMKLHNHFQAKYTPFLKNLIVNSQLSPTNMVISLYFLYKHYHKNSIICTKLEKPQQNGGGATSNDVALDPTHIYMIITSLILSNKSFDDQSYTLKTWFIIINNTCKNFPFAGIGVDLKLINAMEAYFLSSVNFQLSFVGMSSDALFWSLFEHQAGVVGVEDVTLSMFKSLSGYDVPQVDFVSTTPVAMQPQQPQPQMLYETPRQQSYEQTYQAPFQPYDQSQLDSQFVAPPYINVDSITPPVPAPPQLTTTSCSPLENTTTFSSYYPLTPNTPLDYCCKRRKLEQPILPSQMLPQPPSQQQQQQLQPQLYFQTTAPQSQHYQQQLPQYAQPQQWASYQVPLPYLYW